MKKAIFALLCIFVCVFSFPSVVIAADGVTSVKEGDFVVATVSSASDTKAINTLMIFDTETKYVWYYNTYGDKMDNAASKWKFKDLSAMIPKDGFGS